MRSISMADSEIVISSIQQQSLQDVEQQQQEKVNGVQTHSPTPSHPVPVSEEEEKKVENNEFKEVRLAVTDMPEGDFLVSKTNDNKHSKEDIADPHEASSTGTTTPTTESNNSSPIFDLSENKKVLSDKAESSSESSSTKEKIKTGSVSQKPRLKYSRDQLLKLMDVPASRLWPEYFDVAFKKSQGKLDFERWMKAKQDSQRGDWTAVSLAAPGTPLSSGSSGSGSFTDSPIDLEIKKSRDPRERIKEDQDGIILSPQRRSFGTGCHVSQHSSLTLGGGSDSALDRTRESHREIPARRIGSGRILRRDEPDLSSGDRRRDRDSGDRDLDTRRDHSKDWRSKNEIRFEREREERNSGSVKFIHQFNSRQDGKHENGQINISRKIDSAFRLSGHMDKRRRFFEEEDKRSDRRDLRDRRFSDYRRPSNPKDVEEETPEWFTGGPSSQNEFIELVGFDEPQQEEKTPSGKPKRERRRSKREKEDENGKNSRSNTPIIVEKEEPAETEPAVAPSNTEDHQPKKASENPVVIEPASNDQDAMQFNVEDYLGSILNLGSDEMVVQGGSGASRLKQFFKNRDSPVEESEAPANSSLFPTGLSEKSKFPQLGNLLCFAEPIIRIPSPITHLESPHFFTPISPANKTCGDALVEMLHQASGGKKTAQQQPAVAGSGRLLPPSVKELLMGGKGQSLEEIEANMRKGQQQQQQQPLCGLSSFTNSNLSAPGKQPSVQAQMRQQNIANQQNLFSEFLLKDSAHNVGLMTNKPAMPNNAPTESELIARLMKSGVNANLNAAGMVPISSMNGPPPTRHQPPIVSLNLPRQLSPNPPSTIPQHSPSRTHLMPPQQQLSSTSNSDIFMKLMQNQQQLQQQKMLHPGYQPQSQQQQALQHDPIKQLVGGMSSLGLNSAQQNPDPVLREAPLRPDVQSLLQRVVSGQVTDAQLIVQLNSGNMTHPQRDTVAAVLKLISYASPASLMPHRTSLTPSPTPQSMMGGGLTLGTTPSSLSPRVASPNPEGTNMLAPHMMQQTRVSPLMFGGSAGPRRTPSHQELVVHTQGILQRALLKQGLEKAKEKHRKKDAERTLSPNPAAASLQNGPTNHAASMNRVNQDGSPTKGAKCQSPLAFTPTSVMRKMTAEKDRLEKDKQPEGFYGFSVNETEKTREHINRMSNHSQNPTIHHPGINLKVDKRVRKVPSPLPAGNSMLGPRAQMVMSGAQTNPLLNMGLPTHGLRPPQRHISLQPNISIGRSTQHNVNSIRALQHAQAHQASLNQQMLRNQMPHVNSLGQHHSMHSRLPTPQNNPMQHLVVGNNNNNYKQGENSLQVPRPVGSASSQNNSSVNNLMNLFGRDVMAKVQAGAMPELPGGKALSLEEVERIQQTQTVPN